MSISLSQAIIRLPYIIVITLLVDSINSYAQNIHKFERLNVADGLSQNMVQSILCDDKGFLWFGTWDGLNRYDGRNFKVFKASPNQENSLTSNRVVDLWQDKQNIMWVKTYDGFVHYFVEETYEFVTYPNYFKALKANNSTITSFTETDEKEIFLGTTNSGLYHLKYDETSNRYIDRRFVTGEAGTISDNAISFITCGSQGDFWIGTEHGLNHLSRQEINQEKPNFSIHWPEDDFTVGYSLDSILLFGTEKHGIRIFETETQKFVDFPELFKDLSQGSITVIEKPYPNKLLVGTGSSGLYVYDLQKGILQKHLFEGKEIKKIYRDSFQTLWVNTQELGIYSVDPTFTKIKHHVLVPSEFRNMLDDERQFIFEDSKKNLWIGLHTGGLAHYNRNTEEFEFYRHVPNDNTTISSNNVYCITEDKNGLLWIGTGHPKGGVNKIHTINKAFRLITLEEKNITGNENVVRSILVDRNGYTWVGTKAGTIYILDKEYRMVSKYHEIPLVSGVHPGKNAYSMMQDKDGFVWIGTKGAGIFVTEQSLDSKSFDYEKLRFINYDHDPQDSLSLSSNMVFSVFQDSEQRIWIGLYRGGVNLVTKRTSTNLSCLRYNTSNSNLSSDKVRYITEDSSKKLWVATAFGLNYLDLKSFDRFRPDFSPHLHDPRRANSLSYNDVVYVLEDSKNQLWVGTLGGGINKLNAVYKDSLNFTHYNSKNGLVDGVVYSIVEDKHKNIWFGTDHGISKYNTVDDTYDNFDRNNNFVTDAFNENACAVSENGDLLFGKNDGLLVVKPEMIKKDNVMPTVALTNFQLFNKDIDIKDPKSPIKQDIETLDAIKLNHLQSSFSIEYAALSYYAPSKTRYAFILENFDEKWNEVGSQNKATYTNLPPGKYIFRVKAANWNSDWSNKIRSISITILPPWWRTNTAYLAYAILAILIFEVSRRSYLKYHKMQNDLKVEKRVNDIKLQFFTNISHEIRTPLTLILGPIHDILESRITPPDILKKLQLVEKNGNRMLRLVNQLLDFRKVQKKKMALNIHRVELTSFIRSIIENFDLIAEHKKVKIDFHTNVENPDVWVDPNKFDSVIFNILSNALKFSSKGGKVTISIDQSSKDYIDIVFSDEGPGIPKDKMNLVFERFSPLSKENEEFGSSGIGLAFSYQIMKLHHGDIFVSSEVNKGSTFTIRLLQGSQHFSENEILHDENGSPNKIIHQKIAPDEDVFSGIQNELPDDKKCLVLIVEDNLQILRYLEESLKKDYNISTATNGKEALSFISANQPDIVITDIMMPVMNGIELTQHLKSSIETSHIPVIMLTAKSSTEDQILGIESGAEAYILKPFNLTYVRAVISNLIKQRRIVHLKYIQNKDHSSEDLKITNKDEKFLNDVTRLIMENYSDPDFNVEKLVSGSYVSRTVFYHKIKSLTGLCPIDFLRQKRLHIASQMILETDYNVSEIAIITGFGDTKNFSKRFKEIYKLTPTQYKQEMLSHSNP